MDHPSKRICHASGIERNIVIRCKQRTAEAMNVTNESVDLKCEICFERKSVHIPVFTCTHSNTFCKKCVEYWLTMGHSTCPKCRAKRRIQNNLETTDQSDVDIAHFLITMDNDSPSTTSCSAAKILCCLFGFFIVVLVYVIIHWYSNKIKNNG